MRTRPRSNSSWVIVSVGPAPSGIHPASTACTNGSLPSGMPLSANAMRVKTALAFTRLTVWCGTNVVAVRGAIHPLPAAHRICGFAQKPLGTSVNPPDARAGEAKPSSATTAAAKKVERPLTLR